MSNDRLPYHAPQLRDHGTVREITQAGATFNGGTDNGYTTPGDPTPSLS